MKLGSDNQHLQKHMNNLILFVTLLRKSYPVFTANRHNCNERADENYFMTGYPGKSPTEFEDTVASLRAVIGSILILTVAIAVVFWCNWRVRNIPAGIKNNKFAFNNPTVTVISNSHYQAGQGQSQAITESNTRMSGVSGNDNQYEDVDNINTTPKMIASDHDQTGRCQHRAITSPNKYTTAAMVTSGHNHQYENMHSQKGQSRLQAITESITNTTSAEIASGHGHPYEDTNQHNQTGQGQGQVITESNKNTTAAVVATCHGHQYVNVKQHNLKGRGQCQVITESTTNTTAAVVTGDHDQTGRPEQAQPVTDPMDAKNASYGAGPISSNVNSMYKAVVLEYGSPVWGGLPRGLAEELEKVQRSCCRIIGIPYEQLPTLESRRRDATVRELRRVVADATHPCQEFLQPATECQYQLRRAPRFKLPLSRSNRHSQSFIPRALALLNDN
uniref:Uncharacterized protein n=1 Tax=Branchiostoma floridae TaxID=7739 RepID=C3Y737_BRAFL|eukprot:XP_002608137.1 hypothetical protein BRAFLDRAFT_126259 [Branchiostoma floridae]